MQIRQVADVCKDEAVGCVRKGEDWAGEEEMKQQTKSFKNAFSFPLCLFFLFLIDYQQKKEPDFDTFKRSFDLKAPWGPRGSSRFPLSFCHTVFLSAPCSSSSSSRSSFSAWRDQRELAEAAR